ncbi:MAG: mannose-6-phosphate isomerase-like protein (cupin superfamily) [Haloarculaceae archaeon]|jgi:mannose-6-phosphate isomerase-like protein (cupin superfamily)
MGYHLVDPDDLDQWDDRPTDVRSLSTAAGLEAGDSKLGLRVYDLAPGEQPGLQYHYHDEQVEVFYVFDGELHVETPEDEYVVGTDQALFVDPGSPQRAFNPEDAAGNTRVLAIGAPSADDVHAYDPDEE